MTTKRRAADAEDLKSEVRELEGDQNLGLRHARGVVWQQGVIREWAAEIQAHILNHKYEIMKPGAVRGDAGRLFLEVTQKPRRLWELDLNDYIDLFPREDTVLRTFAGIHRLGDEYIGMDEPMEKWYQTWVARAVGVPAVVLPVVLGLSSSYGDKLMQLAQLAQWKRNLEVAISANNATLTSLLQNQTAFRNIGETNATRALIAANATANATITLQAQQFTATISNATNLLQAQQSELTKALASAETIQQSFHWGDRAMSVLSEGFHTGIRSITEAAEVVAPFFNLDGAKLLTLGAMAAVGGIAYYLFKHRARSAFSEVNMDRARDKIASISRTIAKATMEQVLREKSDITADDFHQALKQQRSRENENSQEMKKLWQRYMEIQEENRQRQRQQQFMLDQMTLTTMIQQYRSFNVDPFQLLVYIGSQVKNHTIDADAAREVMTKFANPGTMLSGSGQLMQDLRARYDELKQQSQGANTALAAETRQQKGQALEQLRKVEQMIVIVNGLRENNWSIAAISAIDWDHWSQQFNTAGVLPVLQQKFYDFRSEHGHSLRSDPPRTIVLTREAKELFESKEYDTVFTGDAALEDPARGTLVISYQRNTFEPDDGRDMWRERDIPLRYRPKLVPDLVGNSTMNAERAISILEKALTESFWLPRKDSDKMTEGDRSLFNSYQALWLYRWMGPACSRWLSPEEEKDFSPGYETLPRPHNPLDKRQRTELDPVRKLPLASGAGAQTLAFVSDRCRRRFAFLKAMLAHSLLFLFVRPDETIDLITKPGQPTNPSCVYQTLQRLRGMSQNQGKGYGLLLLDNARPGYVRVVGLGEDGAVINESLNVADLVDISVNPQNPKKWTFNHHQVLLKTVTTAFNLGLRLVSNVCWKSQNKYAETPQDFGRMAEYLRSFPEGNEAFDVRAFRDAQYLYEQSKSAALLTYLTLKNDNCKLAIERAHLRYYRNTQGTQDLDQRLQTIGDLWRNHRGLQNRNGSYSSGWDSGRIDNFRQQEPADAAFVAAATQAYIYDTAQLDNLRAWTTATLGQEELWAKMFEKHGYSRCEKGPVIILNTLCVNPFALCLYEKPESTSENQKTLVHRVFGDLWFLQPLIQEFAQNTRWGFSLKRFMEIQNWHRDDRRRYYLQDSLYLDKWASFLGARPQ